MSQGRHRIHRQILQVEGCPPESAARLQQRFRDVFHARLLPTVDRLCTAVPDARRLRRIERLEIDLGTVPLATFEAAVADAFDNTFGDRLMAALRQHSGDAAGVPSSPAGEPDADGDETALDLVAVFVLTGTLPWWADRGEPWIVEAALAHARRDAAAELRVLLQQLAEPWLSAQAAGIRTAWPAGRRLTSACREPQLSALVAGLLPAAEATAVDAVGHLVQRLVALIVAAVSDLGGPLTRERVWQWLIAAAAVTTPAAARRDFVTRVADILVAHVDATVTGQTRADLSAVIRARGLANGSPTEPWLDEFVFAVARRRSAAPAERAVAAAAGFTSATRGDGASPFAPPAAVAGAAAAGPARARHPDTPPGAGGIEPAPRRHRPMRVVPVPREPASAPPIVGRLRPVARSVDVLAVDNAGLVILWPFLERLFTRLGLLEGRAFTDDAAMQRATAILHHVATGDEETPEFRLLLEKVLCGVTLDDVCEPGPALSQEERETCRQMLEAAIDQAPVLRAMSVAGFRASFLWREGRLQTRDGRWLLHVPRETHDIVLDRFPWTWSVLKLPWMAAPLQVEWR